MDQLTRLRVSRPQISADLAKFYNDNLEQCISIEELVAMLIFIEYFTLPEDRDAIRGDYLLSMSSRFGQMEIGSLTVPQLINRVKRDNVAIGFSEKLILGSQQTYIQSSILEDVEPGYKPTEIVMSNAIMAAYGQLNNLLTYQGRMQTKFLEFSEYIEHVYNEIVSFYRHSNSHSILENLSGSCLGGIPTISSIDKSSIEIMVHMGHD